MSPTLPPRVTRRGHRWRGVDTTVGKITTWAGRGDKSCSGELQSVESAQRRPAPIQFRTVPQWAGSSPRQWHDKNPHTRGRPGRHQWSLCRRQRARLPEGATLEVGGEGHDGNGAALFSASVSLYHHGERLPPARDYRIFLDQ